MTARSPKSPGRSEEKRRTPKVLRASSFISRPARCGKMARAAQIGSSPFRRTMRPTQKRMLRPKLIPRPRSTNDWCFLRAQVNKGLAARKLVEDA